MNKKYDEATTPSVSQGPEGVNGLKVRSVLSRREFKINFDDAKYAVKTVKTQFLETEQQPSKLRGLLRSVPVIGRFLVRILTPEKEAHRKLQPQFSKAKGETRINNRYTEGINSKFKEGNVEQVNKDGKNRSS